MNHAHWAPAASCLSMVATSPHSLSAISLSGKAFFSASKSVASPAALVLWYTSRPIISTYASPGYQSLSFVSLVHTQIRLFSPFCLKVSYTSFQSRLYEAASFPHQNHLPAASCNGLQITGIFFCFKSSK